MSSPIVFSDLSALRSARAINDATSRVDDAMLQLSTGLRINSASDDPAGLGLAERLQLDSRIATVAIRSATDAASLISTTDAALGQISNILMRMGELAEQSASGVINNKNRSSLSAEFQALGSEVSRISRTSNFEGVKLLSATQAIDVQVGLAGGDNSVITIDAVDGTLQQLRLGTGDRLDYSIIEGTEQGSRDAALTALEAVKAAVSEVNEQRGGLGAANTRLSEAINGLESQRAERQSGASVIRDVDVAEQVANLVQAQIVQQAAAGLLASANQQRGVVFGLISG